MSVSPSVMFHKHWVQEAWRAAVVSRHSRQAKCNETNRLQLVSFQGYAAAVSRQDVQLCRQNCQIELQLDSRYRLKCTCHSMLIAYYTRRRHAGTPSWQ